MIFFNHDTITFIANAFYILSIKNATQRNIKDQSLIVCWTHSVYSVYIYAL